MSRPLGGDCFFAFFAAFDSKPKIFGGGKPVSIGARRSKLSQKTGPSPQTSKAAPQMQSTGMILKKLPKPVAMKLTSDLVNDWDDFKLTGDCSQGCWRGR
jgi:hypothetical protein